MKFLLERACEIEDLGVIEINNLDELKQPNNKYNSKEKYAWSDSHSIIIDFDVNKEDKEKGIDGRITIYDYYVE